MENFISDQQQR